MDSFYQELELAHLAQQHFQIRYIAQAQDLFNVLMITAQF
jgi:hypothetical protein